MLKPARTSNARRTGLAKASSVRGAGRRPQYIAIVVSLLAAVAITIWGGAGFPALLRLNVGQAFETVFSAFATDYPWAYEPFAVVLDGGFELLLDGLYAVSPVVLAGVGIIALTYYRGLKLGVLLGVAVMWVVLTGLWDATVETVAFMLVAIAAAMVFGLVIGFIGSLSNGLNTAVKAVLDTMQAFPAFAYLVPVVYLFGLGNTAALVVTVIWATPPLARMTAIGLRRVSPDSLEAAESIGASSRQILFGVKFPMASSAIQAGTNQLIMFAIAMATMSAMVGAAGLGRPVWGGLSRLALGDALEAGIALVLVAVIIDRASAPRSRSAAGKDRRDGTASFRERLRALISWPLGRGQWALLSGLLVVVVAQAFRGPWQNLSDPIWGAPISLKEPVDAFVLWVTVHLGPFLAAVSDALQMYALNLLGSLFTGIPWALTIALVFIAGSWMLSIKQGLILAVGATLIGSLGMWDAAADTMAVVVSALFIVILLGFPLGVLMAASDRTARILRPVLDVLQTLPVYLFVIPAVMFFGVGEVSAVFATVIAAAPPVVRYTNAALRDADPEVVEAAQLFGATRGQILRQIRIPMGLPTIMVGINQALLLALTMAVVSSLVGAPGLGGEIYVSVFRADLALGFEAGFAMLLLGMVWDRLFNGVSITLTGTKPSSTLSGKV